MAQIPRATSLLWHIFGTRGVPNIAIHCITLTKCARRKSLIYKAKLVRLAGIEPTTLGFGGQYSIH
jgi:hypothetical protein